MIKIEKFEDTPMLTGQRREIVLSGNEPFKITNSCFVDSPPPPGFRPCAACGAVQLNSNEVYEIESDPHFWHGKEGTMVVEITDSIGNSKTLKIKVLSDSGNASGQITMGA